MVDIEEVGVQVDVLARGGGLDGGPGALLDEEVVRDGGEEGAGRKSDEGGCVGVVGVADAVDVDEIWVAGLRPGGTFGFDCDGHV